MRAFHEPVARNSRLAEHRREGLVLALFAVLRALRALLTPLRDAAR